MPPSPSDTRKRWCCEQIEARFKARKERGAAVCAVAPFAELSNEPTFWLFVRAVSADDLEKIKSRYDMNDIALAVNAFYPIRFCPWCGESLNNFYQNSYSQLIDDNIDAEFGRYLVSQIDF